MERLGRSGVMGRGGENGAQGNERVWVDKVCWGRGVWGVQFLSYLYDRSGRRQEATHGEWGVGRSFFVGVKVFFGETSLGLWSGSVWSKWEKNFGIAGAQPVWAGKEAWRSAERRSGKKGRGKGNGGRMDRGRVLCVGKAGGVGKATGNRRNFFLRGLRLGFFMIWGLGRLGVILLCVRVAKNSYF